VATKPSAPQDTPPSAPIQQKFNPMQLYTEVREELSKVVWPDRQKVISESAAVILIVAASASFVYLVDSFFVFIASKVF
jgi:preprotein translocase subunit SecE